ncbi:hypothetical protein Goarm_002280 [Gossypium armourianum]|uniref:BAHD acyltransferase DCR-like n=1 Tax=Gossypium armourianum TaxID=34283 RepID=A0A7J9K7L7_9ROSI|nr:hypothetical protein [Gossypium armourianum]
MPSSPSFTLVSRCTVSPDQISDIKTLKLSVSDIPMLSCQYIQKGVLLTSPPYSFDDLVCFLKQSLSTTLSYFPPLAGRLTTDPDGHVHITCNDAGIDFLVVKSPNISIHNVLVLGDVPDCVKQFFTFDKTLSYSGHFKPLAAVQVTELADGVFIGCIVNHAVTDGTSFWHFFNTFAEITKGALKISKSPDFGRNTVREAILKLKYRANYGCLLTKQTNSEVLGKLCNDSWKSVNVETNGKVRNSNDEISSFQSLCAQLWRSVTRARKLEPTKTTTFRMAVNCRHRLDPKLEPYYFGNAIQSIPTFASAGELLGKDLSWAADILHKNVVAHNNDTVRKGVADWEKQPRLFPLGNADGASITMGSSPRFPMYNNDFGWGRPLAVRSGRANKFDGKISAFPGRDGNGSVDLEVVLAPDTMLEVENDPEIMQYVSEFL